MAKDKDRDFVEFIVKEIVTEPNDVEVTRQVDEMGVLLSVKVNPKDMGLLIGRQGSTAKAIRTLARIIGMRNNARVNLRIEEPEGGRAPSASGNKTKNVEDVMGELDM
ncbi:MAG: KH domain-containing protein [bacterium]|nr:KH domain-containing protein [bacterium]